MYFPLNIINNLLSEWFHLKVERLINNKIQDYKQEIDIDDKVKENKTICS